MPLGFGFGALVDAACGEEVGDASCAGSLGWLEAEVAGEEDARVPDDRGEVWAQGDELRI